MLHMTWWIFIVNVIVIDIFIRNMYIIFEEKTSDLPVDGAVDVVIVSSGLKMLINKYLY